MFGLESKIETLDQRSKEFMEKRAKRQAQNFDQSEIEYEIQ